MPLPDPLPPQFRATLRARITALIAHGIVEDGRQRVEVDGLEVAVAVDGDRLRLVSFPDLEVEVATAIGAVRAVVSVEGEPQGAFDPVTGHAALEADLHLDAKHLLARDSDARVSLTTDGALDEPGLEAEGDPLDAGDDVVRLVGTGALEGGSLDGGTLWLVVDGRVESVEPAG